MIVLHYVRKKQTTTRKDSIHSVWNFTIWLYDSSVDGRGNKRRTERKGGPATWKQLCASRGQKQTGLLCHRCPSVVSLHYFVRSGVCTVWMSCEFPGCCRCFSKTSKSVHYCSKEENMYRHKLFFSRLALPDSVWGDLLHPSHSL